MARPGKARFEDRTRALDALAAGLVTVAEAAEFAGVMPQSVNYWIKRARIDPIEARNAYLRQLWGERA